MVLQETVSVPDSAVTDEQKEEESLSFTGKVSPVPSVPLSAASTLSSEGSLGQVISA